MTVQRGLLAMLEAKPGKGPELEAFLDAGRAIAVAESGTVTWYAFKLSDTSYGVFDLARMAHPRYRCHAVTCSGTATPSRRS